MRRVATRERFAQTAAFNRRYATPFAVGCSHRGLKPTATCISSLRDDVCCQRRPSGRTAADADFGTALSLLL